MKPILLLLLFTVAALAQAPTVAEKNAPAKVTLTSQNEPGERLTVSGVVYGADGKPLAGASVYVYHTDATGRYTPGPQDDNRNPRLRGYLRTDAQGRYEYTTIKPAPYPGENGPPAHIHYHVNAPGHQERVFEIIFEGDPRISAQIRAEAAKEDSGFSQRKLTREATGGWRCTQDVKLKKS